MCVCVFLSECQSSLEAALTPSRASRALPGTDTHIRSPIGSHQAGGIPLMSAGILFPGTLVSVRAQRHVCYYGTHREIAVDNPKPPPNSFGSTQVIRPTKSTQPFRHLRGGCLDVCRHFFSGRTLLFVTIVCSVTTRVAVSFVFLSAFSNFRSTTSL